MTECGARKRHAQPPLMTQWEPAPSIPFIQLSDPEELRPQAGIAAVFPAGLPGLATWLGVNRRNNTIVFQASQPLVSLVRCTDCVLTMKMS